MLDCLAMCSFWLFPKKTFLFLLHPLSCLLFLVATIWQTLILVFSMQRPMHHFVLIQSECKSYLVKKCFSAVCIWITSSEWGGIILKDNLVFHICINAYFLKTRCQLSWYGVMMNAVCTFTAEAPYSLNRWFLRHDL